MRAGALLLGAGAGERLAGRDPKAFLVLEGRTLLELAVATIEACRRVEGYVVAAPEGWQARARSAAGPSSKLLAVVAGGRTRSESVREALRALPAKFDVVVCHDVARPFAPPRLFDVVLDAVEAADGAVPALPVSDTVKRVDEGRVAETVSRDGLMLVQTPQAFRREALEAAHAQDRADAPAGRATDDAALLERAGFTVAVVPGDPSNLKITTPDDLRLAASLARGHG